MVEKIIVNPQKVRGLGNISMEKSVTDFERYYSSIIQSDIVVNGVAMTGYTMAYSVYGVGFGFTDDHRFYCTSDDGVITGFSFDSTGKRLTLSDDSGAVVGFIFDNVNKRIKLSVE